jgi:hypothetical protein
VVDDGTLIFSRETPFARHGLCHAGLFSATIAPYRNEREKFNVFKSASLVRVVEAENIMEAAEKVGLTNPKMSKYENLVWQWFENGEQSYAIEVCEQE